MNCPDCGRDAPEGARSCEGCGAPLDVTAPAFARAPAPPTPERLASDGSGAAAGAAARGPVAGRFLLSAAFPVPFVLEPGKTYRIGRDRANAIFVPAHAVSRIHAEIVEEKGKWIVRDLGSRNGTLVNGERVIERPLRHGDRITVGNVDLSYHEANEAETRELLEKRARGPGGDTARIVFGSEEFFGDLENVSVTEIAQFLHHNRKTGCLAVRERGGREGRLHFVLGEIVHAECGSEQGEGVAERLLLARSGRFSFRPRPAAAAAPARTCSTPTATLLINAIRGRTLA